MVQRLADAAAADRAKRIAAYVGLEGGVPDIAALAARLVRPDPEDSPIPFAQYRVAAGDAALRRGLHRASDLLPAAGDRGGAGGGGERRGVSRRGSGTGRARRRWREEFRQAAAAIQRGRDAIDGLTEALLRAAQAVWPDRWTMLVPRPVLLATWVGYDTDGRTDIGWWDTLRLRLTMKRLQLERLAGQFAALGDCAAPLAAAGGGGAGGGRGADRRGAGEAGAAGGAGPGEGADRRARGGDGGGGAAAGAVPGGAGRGTGRGDAGWASRWRGPGWRRMGWRWRIPICG